MIGIGVDLCDVGRMRASLARTPTLAERLFTADERAYCEQRRDPAERYAARFAAKEAIAKALGAPGGMSWQDATVRRVVGGPPEVELRGTVLARARELGIDRWHLSISHDAGIASAMAIAERDPA